MCAVLYITGSIWTTTKFSGELTVHDFLPGHTHTQREEEKSSFVVIQLPLCRNKGSKLASLTKLIRSNLHLYTTRRTQFCFCLPTIAKPLAHLLPKSLVIEQPLAAPFVPRPYWPGDAAVIHVLVAGKLPQLIQQ